MGRVRAMVWVACLLGALLAAVLWLANERGPEALDGPIAGRDAEPTGAGPELLGHGAGGASAKGSALPGAHRVKVHGRVVSKAGAPIAGASVWCVGTSYAVDADALRSDVPRTTTDAQGEFRLLADQPAPQVAASAPGYLGQALGPLLPQHPVTIVLAPAVGHVVGMVRDAEGRPLAGAQVVAGAWWERTGAAGITDGEGAFALPRAWAGMVDVVAFATGYVQAEGRAPPAGPDGDSRLDLVLERGRRVRGRVVDAATQQGVGGAEIVEPEAPGTPPRTGPDGAFACFVPPEVATLKASALGYGLGGLNVAQGSEEVDGVVLELRRFVTFEGTVLDEQGQPLPDAEVLAFPGGSARSGPRGEFRVEAVDPIAAQSPTLLGARAGERTPAALLVEGARKDGHILRLGPVTPLRGVVVDAAGAEVGGAWLGLTLASGPLSGRGPDAFAALLGRDFGYMQAQADAAGRFRFTGLPAGVYRVSARRDGGTGAAAHASGAVVPGEPSPELRLVLETGRTVSGTVRDEQGALVGARVHLMCGKDFHGSVETDHEGRFRQEGLPPGNIVVVSGHPGHDDAESMIDAEQHEIEVVLTRRPPARRVRVRLRLRGAAVGEGVRLSLALRAVPRWDSGAHTSAGVTAGHVAFEVELETGTYSVQADGPGVYGGLAELVLPPSADMAQGDLDLHPKLTLGGHVVDPAGRPIARAEVRGYERQPSVRTGADGAFMLRGLLPGRVQVTARAEGYETVPAGFEAGETSASITLHPIVQVSGRVDAAAPLRGAWHIDILPSGDTGAPHRRSTPSPDLSFHLMLRPGVYSAQVVRGGTSRGPLSTFEVLAGAPLEGLVLEAPPPGLRITGRLLDADGGPAAGEQVVLQPATPIEQGEIHRTCTDYAGDFEFAGLAVGTYHLLGTTDLGRFSQQDVRAGTEGLRLRASAFAHITGRVRFPAGAEIEACDVWARTADRGGQWEKVTPRRSNFEFNQLDAATYMVVAQAGTYVARYADWITLAAGARRDGLVLNLVPGGAIEGDVVARDGAPLAGSKISAWGPYGLVASAEADAQGRFRLVGLVDGAWTLTASRPRSAPSATLQVEVDLGRTHSVRLVEAAK